MSKNICSSCHDALDKKVKKMEKKREKKEKMQNRDFNVQKKIETETKKLQEEFEEINKKITQDVDSFYETEKTNQKTFFDVREIICTVICSYSNYFMFGSGFIVKRKNTYYVITCAQLIKKCDVKKIHINLQNENQIICEIVGLDKAADIAVLRPLTKQENINEGYDIINKKFAKFGNSTKCSPGGKCHIISNSNGTDPFFIADGIIRDNKFVSSLQTELMLISASTWSGNSGSPIFDENNNIIGMVSCYFRNNDEYESTLIGGVTQYMLESITRIMIDNYNNNTKGFIGIKKMTTMTDVVLITLKQMFPDFAEINKSKPRGLLILDVDENIKSTVEIKPLDILLEIKNPITKEKINIGSSNDEYHYSRISWFQKIGFSVEAVLLRPLENMIYRTIFTVYELPEKYDELFSNENKKIMLGMKNYTVNSLCSKVNTKDLFDYV